MDLRTDHAYFEEYFKVDLVECRVLALFNMMFKPIYKVIIVILVLHDKSF